MKLLSKIAWALILCAITPIALPAQTFTTLVNFERSVGNDPQSPPIQGLDGNFYGMTFEGGTFGLGIIYKMTPDGELTTIYSFCSQRHCPDGEFPYYGLVLGPDGNFYGTTLGQDCITNVCAGTVFKVTPQGTLTTLYRFCSQPNCADGGSPSEILLARDGNFYGTTLTGGANNVGTIFKLTPRGGLTTLYNFCSQGGCADGYDINESFGTLIEGSDGNFYGTTDIGGSYAGFCDVYGCGTAYKITPQGKFTTIYSFCAVGNCEDGATPYAMVQGADGNFYGATGTGGTFTFIGGTIFKLTPSGKLTTLYSFCAQTDCPDGREPTGIIQAAGDGNFYGTTFFGGSSTCTTGCGTLFEITEAGDFTSLNSFDRSNGNQPYGLAQAPSGTIYGVTSQGGTQTYGGTVYSLTAGLTPFVETEPSSGKDGTTVNILGTNLEAATSVTFNGTTAQFSVVSSSQIKATVPQGATTGTVKVKTPGGTLSSNVAFRVK